MQWNIRNVLAGGALLAGLVIAWSPALLAGPESTSSKSSKDATPVMGLWRDGVMIAKAGDPPVALKDVKEGDEVELAVTVSGMTTFRASEIHAFYDAAGLDYSGWQVSKPLQTALAMNPRILPDENRLVFMVAASPAVVTEAGQPFEIGHFRVVVRDVTHPTVGITYMRVLDEKLGSSEIGTKPEHPVPAKAKKTLHRRDLGDSLWWTEADPNPFAVHTAMTFFTPDSAWVTINVIDKNGRLVRPLVANNYKGRWTTSWSGTEFSAEKAKYGEYVVTFEAAGKVDSQVVRFVDPSEISKQ